MQEAGQAKSLTNVGALREFESAFRVAYSRDEHGRGPVRPTASTEDWSSTLNLVEQTAGALRSAEQRIRELEQRQEELLRAARANLAKAKASIDASEAQALRAEQRAKEAEERAQHCQEWLTRINEGLEQLPKRP